MTAEVRPAVRFRKRAARIHDIDMRVSNARRCSVRIVILQTLPGKEERLLYVVNVPREIRLRDVLQHHAVADHHQNVPRSNAKCFRREVFTRLQIELIELGMSSGAFLRCSFGDNEDSEEFERETDS